ncbi:MAG: hypothetical protein AAFV43_00125 [Planctomycetota bacterium]
MRLAPEYRIDAASIRITPPPAWVAEGFLTDALLRAGLVAPNGVGQLSILDAAGVVEQNLAQATSASPYVRSVTAVSREAPRGANVEVEYRTPAALAITSLGAEPLDAEGVRLPRGRLTTADLASLPRFRLQRLEGAGLPAPPLVGAAWNDPRVRGGCALLARLAPYWKAMRLEDLTTDRAPEQRGGLAYPTFTLRTIGDTAVVWGAAEGFGPPNEPSFAEKLSRFRQFVAATGPLDSLDGTPRRVHVRYQLRVEARVAKLESTEDADEPIKQAASPSDVR